MIDTDPARKGNKKMLFKVMDTQTVTSDRYPLNLRAILVVLIFIHKKVK